ncbi:sugar phosphate isomerase/epimerase family protein [Geomicrobium sp. JSM 1781026]|uniref:sugar phosphate isomerase/epimerase family protein n=1 Tax=Geomicrobium sp. JSM 1781026 TaxID=3344580 RepID=UPI0035C08B18
MKVAYPYQTEETAQHLLSAKGKSKHIIPTLSAIGYDGIELLVREPNIADLDAVYKVMQGNDLQVAALSTGPMVADDELSFTARDRSKREEAIRRVIELIVWAERFDTVVTIGKVRGQLLEDESYSWELMRTAFDQVLIEADKRNVQLVIEPQNETHMNNLNGTYETIDYIHTFARSSLGVMLDLVHVEAEQTCRTVTECFRFANELLRFVHLSDSNRLVPGEGSFDVPSVLNTLQQIDYSGFISLEIKQQGDSLDTAKRAIEYLRSIQ